jgi:hypothetical protein
MECGRLLPLSSSGCCAWWDRPVEKITAHLGRITSPDVDALKAVVSGD